MQAKYLISLIAAYLCTHLSVWGFTLESEVATGLCIQVEGGAFCSPGNSNDQFADSPTATFASSDSQPTSQCAIGNHTIHHTWLHLLRTTQGCSCNDTYNCRHYSYQTTTHRSCLLLASTRNLSQTQTQLPGYYWINNSTTSDDLNLTLGMQNTTTALNLSIHSSKVWQQ